MASAATLEIVIQAKDQASSIFKQVENGSAGLGGKLKGLAVGLGAAAAGFASFQVLKGAVESTQELGLSVAKLSRETGLSTEASSQLLFASKHVGLGADDASRAIGIFAKKLKGISDEETGVTGGGKSMAAILADIGVQATDAAGNILPVDQLLGPLADKFKAMPDGLEKTGLAMQLFGRSGKDMIPLLNQGSKGMADLAKQSDKLGLTLSAKNVDQIKQYTFAHRDMEEAIAGVKLQIGLALMPVLTRFAEWFTSHQPEIREFVREGIEKISTVIRNLTPVVEALLPPLQSFGKFIVDHKAALIALIAALVILVAVLNPIPTAIAAIVLATGYVIQHWDDIKRVALEVWEKVKEIFQSFVDWLRGHWVPILIAVLGGPIAFAIYHFRDDIKGVVDAVVGFFTAMPGRILGALSGLWEGLKAGFRDALNWVITNVVAPFVEGIDAAIRLFNKLPGPDIGVIPVPGPIGMPTPVPRGGASHGLGFAAGGFVPGPLGEPRLAVVHGGERVLTPGQAMAAGLHIEIHVTADSEIGISAARMVAREVRQQIEESLSRTNLGGSFATSGAGAVL